MKQRWEVTPASRVSGELRVPGDKSISHRSLMLGGVAQGITEVQGFLASADCLATLDALRAMGIRIERPGETQVRIHGAGLHGLQPPQAPLDMGNAGTAIRLFMGLLSGQSFASTLTGDESLRRRPMERVANPLRLMGAQIDTQDGTPPVRITQARDLQGIDYVLPMASAQVKSAILLAGLYAKGATRVTEPAPTRDHTERMLAGFGLLVQRDGARVTLAATGARTLRGTSLQVPGDISSAAFFLVAGCLAASPRLTLRGVGLNPTRTGIISILQLMGARLRIVPVADAGPEPIADIEIEASPLRGIDIPEELVPLAIDELPVVFIAAACAEGVTRVTGAGELRVKESDRLAVMAEGLAALHIRHELLPDGIAIEGIGSKGRLPGGRIDSHGDHRIAMSFAVASLRADAPIHIEDVANVATSFPGFDAAARAVGLSLVAR
ncbi:MAG: 3-phosphoshikimate 1-carboxyvinyltransferase [Steroidobacteraceae bacterium]